MYTPEISESCRIQSTRFSLPKNMKISQELPKSLFICAQVDLSLVYLSIPGTKAQKRGVPRVENCNRVSLFDVHQAAIECSRPENIHVVL